MVFEGLGLDRVLCEGVRAVKGGVSWSFGPV